MTAQATNMLLFMDREFDITDPIEVSLFDPVAHGFSPVAVATDCYDGFFGEYAIEDSQLVLQNLYISHGKENQRGFCEERWPLPTLFGVEPNLEPNATYGFHGCYMNLRMPLRFSGALLLARDREPRRSMGYARAWHYNEVLRLTFEGGRVVENRDVSNIISRMRTHYLGWTYTGQRPWRDGKRYALRHLGIAAFP